jgi:hypothetical protein
MKIKDPAVLFTKLAASEAVRVPQPQDGAEPAAIGAAMPEWLASLAPGWNIRDVVDLPPRAMRRSFQNRKRELIVRSAYHQLAVQRMTPARRATHDPHCRWCQVRVPWKRTAAANAEHSRSGRRGEERPTGAA